MSRVVVRRAGPVVVVRQPLTRIVAAGIRGPIGPGAGASSSFLFEQPIASAVWTINHNLGFKPAGIYVEDSAGTPNEPSVTYVDDNNIILEFAAPTDGYASLS